MALCKSSAEVGASIEDHRFCSFGPVLRIRLQAACAAMGSEW